MFSINYPTKYLRSYIHAQQQLVRAQQHLVRAQQQLGTFVRSSSSFVHRSRYIRAQQQLVRAQQNCPSGPPYKQVYSVTVMPHVKALQAGQSGQGTFDPITTALISKNRTFESHQQSPSPMTII